MKISKLWKLTLNDLELINNRLIKKNVSYRFIARTREIGDVQIYKIPEKMHKDYIGALKEGAHRQLTDAGLSLWVINYLEDNKQFGYAYPLHESVVIKNPKELDLFFQAINLFYS